MHYDDRRGREAEADTIVYCVLVNSAGDLDAVVHASTESLHCCSQPGAICVLRGFALLSVRRFVAPVLWCLLEYARFGRPVLIFHCVRQSYKLANW